MSYNSSHLRTNYINLSSSSEDKQAALVASKHWKCSGGDIRLFTLSESNRYRPVRTRSVTSNILVQQRRRNGTETWRIRSCQCEHLRLITYEIILLNGDFPRRNGNVTYGVNRPLNTFYLTCNGNLKFWCWVRWYTVWCEGPMTLDV